MPSKRKIKLIADTNVWISTLTSIPFRSRTARLFGADIELLFSDELFRELDNTANKKSLRKFVNLMEYASLVQRLREVVTFVEVQSVIEICRDKKDNFLLALAKDGDADYLITGDDDLLILENFDKTKIVTITEFENIV